MKAFVVGFLICTYDDNIMNIIMAVFVNNYMHMKCYITGGISVIREGEGRG